MILFAVSTGRRRNEIATLRWNHVDLNRGTYSVIVKGNKPQSFPLVGKIVGVLRDLKQQQKVIGTNNLVFALDGSNVPYQFDAAWLEILEDAKLEGHIFHDLRDTAATMILNNSREWSAVAEILGHEEVGQLQRRYARFFPEVLKATLENALPAFLK